MAERLFFTKAMLQSRRLLSASEILTVVPEKFKTQNKWFKYARHHFRFPHKFKNWISKNLHDRKFEQRQYDKVWEILNGLTSNDNLWVAGFLLSDMLHDAPKCKCTKTKICEEIEMELAKQRRERNKLKRSKSLTRVA